VFYSVALSSVNKSGPILHRFPDTTTYWLNCLFFLLLPHLASPLRTLALEFPDEVKREETRVTGLSYSEDCMIVAGVILT